MGNPHAPDAFARALTSSATLENAPADGITAECPSNNWIKLRYEYADGIGVAGAAYVVQRVTSDATPTGEILAEGLTDANGDAHVVLPEGIDQVEYYFHADPDGDPYAEPNVEKPLEEPEPGFFSRLWQAVSEAGDWVWGVLKGDFEEDASTSQIIARMILTMIPGIDQIADGQDVIYVLYKLIWKREYDNPGHWIMLFITLIGLIPSLGSLAKGVLKLVWKKADDLLGLYRLFNWFEKGNAHRWLRNFATDLAGTHLSAVKTRLLSLLSRAFAHMEEAKSFFDWGWKNRILDEGIAKIRDFIGRIDAGLTSAAQRLQAQLLEALSKGMTRIRRGAAKNQQPHVLRQEIEAPPSYRGRLRGSSIDLPGVRTQRIDYTKRPRTELADLRREFNDAKRAEFVQDLANDPIKEAQLRAAGLSDADIAKMRDGGVPSGWQVHHKLPLDDGGTNDSSNLVLIENDPSHLVLTNAQRELTGTMTPGETRVIDFPVPDGFVYPPSPGLVTAP